MRNRSEPYRALREAFVWFRHEPTMCARASKLKMMRYLGDVLWRNRHQQRDDD